MSRCEADPNIARMIVDGFQFPLGSYPVEEMKPKAGYTVQFEPADGDDEDGEWEEWPDRYVFDAVISAERVLPLCRTLLSIFPGRVYPILDVLGHDAYREIDPYISYDLIGVDRFIDALRSYRAFFFEDGLVGFGAMSDDPFVYMFVDEHKIVTVRAAAPLRERIEKILAAFDLEAMPEPAGADAAAHEHRGVLHAPDDRSELLNAEEIVERLRDEWRLVLNVDPEGNVDDDGNTVGVVPWVCLVRVDPPEDDEQEPKYAEAIVTAGSLSEAESLTKEACEALPDWVNDESWEAVVVSMNRLTSEDLSEILGRRGVTGPVPEASPARVIRADWL